MKMLPLATLLAATSFSQFAHANVLSAKEADAICRKKAVAAARFISTSSQRFLVSYKAGSVAEISTPITYEFTTQSAIDAGLQDSLYTVHAYAYPDDKTCLIGVISNDLAGND